MPTVSTEITIAAAPEKVRAVVLDFAKYPEWAARYIKKISVTQGSEQEIKPGDHLSVETVSLSYSPVVQVNKPSELEWRGSVPDLFTGAHRFEFTESPSHPGGTRLLQSEDFSDLSFSIGDKGSFGEITRNRFEAFNEEIKARVESL